MKLKTGGIYRIERKPLHHVSLHECKGEHYTELYTETMNCKILSIKDNISGRKKKHLVCFLPTNVVDYLYTDWLRKAGLLKILRNLDDWPEEARHHFLMLNGASSKTVYEGTIEEARRQITLSARADRLFKEKLEKKNKDKATLTIKNSDVSWWHDNYSSSTTGHVYVPTYSSAEWVEIDAPDIPEEAYIPSDEEILSFKTTNDPPNKTKKKKNPAKKKKVPHVKVPPVTVTKTIKKDTELFSISQETLKKVVEEVEKKKAEHNKAKFAHLYGGPGYTGYATFKKKKAEEKQPKTFKEWAQSVECEFTKESEEETE